MKNYIHIIISSLIFLAITTGCVTNEKEIFSLTPAERMNQALETNFSLLTSAENGWEMEYFATPNSPGYTLLVKFNRSGSATFASKSELTLNKEYEKDSCLFEMIGDDGPVLTFNTYNNVLHRFSNPVNPDGYGLEGDYEFIVMKADSNQITLKGKKRSTIIILNKLPLSISWNSYVESVDSMNSILFSENAPSLTMTIESSNYIFSNGSSHVFSILKQGPSSIAIEAPFLVTNSGIRLYSEMDIEGNKIKTFTLNDDKSALVSIDNPDLKLLGPTDLANYFTGNVFVWDFLPDKMSLNFKTAYDAVVQSCVDKYNAQDVKLTMKYYTTRKTFVLSLSFTTSLLVSEGNLDLKLTTSGKNSLAVSYKGTGDLNGTTYYSEIQGLNNLTTLLTSGFDLSTFALINPQIIKFIDKTNSNSWFSLKRNQ